MMDSERSFKNFSTSTMSNIPNAMNHLPPPGSYSTIANSGYTPYIGNTSMPPISSSMTLPLAPPSGVSHSYGNYDTGHCVQNNMYNNHIQHGYNLAMLHPPMTDINVKKENSDLSVSNDDMPPVGMPIVTSSTTPSNMNVHAPLLAHPPPNLRNQDNSPPGSSLNKSDDSTTDSNVSDTVNNKEISANVNNIPLKKRARSVSDDKKDPSYWDKRKKNNESAKRSRDSRRMKEEQIAMRVVYLEQENLQLRTEVSLLRSEIEKLRCMLYNS